VLAVGVPLALAYFVLIGGTPAGEVLAPLRMINAVLGAVAIVVYVWRLPMESDRTDRSVVTAVLLFAVVAVLSAFPRQSLDAYLACVAYAALFYVGRGLFGEPRIVSATVWVMRGLSVVVTGVLAARTIPAQIEWLQLAGGGPLIGIPVVARPWGNAYDLAMLGVLLFPSWLIAPITRARAVAAGLTALALGIGILLLGARAVWLAVAVASIGLLVPIFVRTVSRGGRATRRLIFAAIAATVVGLVALAGPLADRLLDFATVGQRLEMWSSATQAWLDRPIAGLGIGSFPWILQTTDHFATNSIHPRHPDSAIFQLLPEAGILGVAAAVIMVGAIAWPLLRARRYLVLWPLIAFAVAGIGANPTDFSYVVIVAIVWAALGLPRITSGVGVEAIPRLRVPMLAFGAVVLVPVVGATLAAGVAYDAAVRASAAGDLAAVERSLDTAITLDPGMALYARQRGSVRLLRHDPEAAVHDLRRAARLNPYDDVTWRTLSIALADSGDDVAAEAALTQALTLQRSDPTNLLLLASRQRQSGDNAGRRATLAEIALAWPTTVAAPGWSELVGDLPTTEVISDAIGRWQARQASPEPLRQQPLLVSAIASRLDLLPQAERLAGTSRALSETMYALAHCDDAARALIDAVSTSDRRTSTYWALRLQIAAEFGEADPTAHRVYPIIAAENPRNEDASERMNPLQENNAQGSVDAWGYDRAPIVWPIAPFTLPLPSAGAARWMLDPDTARSEMEMSDIGSCGGP
jgi:O-antigen ligase